MNNLKKHVIWLESRRASEIAPIYGEEEAKRQIISYKSLAKKLRKLISLKKKSRVCE